MGFITQTHYQYYNAGQKFTATNNQTVFTLTLDPLPAAEADFIILINDSEVDDGLYTYNASTGAITFSAGRATGDILKVNLVNPNTGDYRYISLKDIANNFIVSYVGEGKIIPKIKRADVLFHAKRGIQEFSYDISRIEKIQEVEVGDALSIPMPQDYVDYVQISRVDSLGIEIPLYPIRFTSMPSQAILQDSDYEYLYDNDDSVLTATPVTSTRYKDQNLDNISELADNNETIDRAHARYGLLPELAQKNGNFLIDEVNGSIHFSSDMAEQIITIKYVSDGMGTDAEMKVHKFAEEAIYKHILYSVVSSRANFPEYIVHRYKRDRFAAMRNTKLRLANLNPRELARVMRNKSKVIKH
ncbi:MAG: hypothetical protein H8D84_00480 [Proteobacteria bacterium]|nr:hypothetical protein [Pseudomonadota bacterium]